MQAFDAGFRAHGARQNAVEELAADWLARRDAGFSEAERSEFERWLAADPHHERAVSELSGAWAVINRPRMAGASASISRELAAREQNRRARRRRRVVFGFATASLGAAAAIVFMLRPERSEPRPSAVAAVTESISPRPERRLLVDGSVVELNVGADIAVEFSATRRDVRLVRGEAHFAVAKDETRPFVVTAGRVSVRAVGTEFAVRFAMRDVDVLVTEGQVEVAHVPAASSSRAVALVEDMKPVRLEAGRKITVLADAPSSAPAQIQPVSGAQIAQALAWRGKRVEFTGTPLADAIALFNRQNALQLSFADRTLGELRVSGIFWSGDPEGFARLLEGSMGIKAQRRSEREITLHKAQ